MHPSAGIRRQVSEKVGDSASWSKLCQQVEMIRSSVEFETNATDLSQRAADVIVKPNFMFRCDQRASIFG